jgi:ubiquinone/menaquinone biosynthesis C-methylase UbiE
MLSLDEIETQTVAAYDLLAPEYDASTHVTTRILERLSLDAFADVIGASTIMADTSRILDIGCGTGALSRLLLRSTHRGVEFVFLDASAQMLDLARIRLKELATQKAVRYFQASVVSNGLYDDLGHFDLVTCGLGDPYFVERAVVNMRLVLGCIVS